MLLHLSIPSFRTVTSGAIIPLAAICLAVHSEAQTVIHYWDFSTPTDVVGGLATSEIGAPDLSVHPTYGEAYPGAGESLNPVVGGTSAGGGHLSVEAHDGTNATALDFGLSSFAFSFWVYDANDGDARTTRVFDNLLGSSTGLQCTGTSIRIDDDTGGSSGPGIGVPNDAWAHVVINVERTPNGFRARVFIDGLLESDQIATVVPGNIFSTQDLLIGAINGGSTSLGAQSGGIDDLAVYDDILGTDLIAGLSAGTLTPTDIVPFDPNFCFGDGTGAACPCGNTGQEGAGCANTTGMGAILTSNGDASVMSNQLTFDITGGTLSTFAVLVSGDNALGGGLGIVGLPAKDGLRCVGGNLLRHGTRALNEAGANDDPWGSLTGPNGGIIGGSGFTAGQTRYFQARYRENPLSGPCSTDQNSSQGFAMTFTM